MKAFELQLCNYILQSQGWHKTVCHSGTASNFLPATSSIRCLHTTFHHCNNWNKPNPVRMMKQVFRQHKKTPTDLCLLRDTPDSSCFFAVAVLPWDWFQANKHSGTLIKVCAVLSSVPHLWGCSRLKNSAFTTVHTHTQYTTRAPGDVLRKKKI